VTSALARSLLLADAVTREALAEALLISATRGTSLVRALLATGAIQPARLEQQLERGDAPVMRHIAPVMSLVEHLPPGLCERLLALPVRRDPRTGTIDVAVVDARDPHAVAEVSYWLKAPVRMIRTSLSSMDAALRRAQRKPDPPGMRSLAPPIWVPTPSEHPRPRAETPVYGTPALSQQQAEGPGPTLDDIPAPAVGHNIPFPLKRRDSHHASLVELANGVHFGAPESGEAEPVLDLRKRKGAPSPPPSRPAPLPGPGRDVVAFLGELREARSRDAIFEILVKAASVVAGKVVVLAVKKGELAGWTGSPEAVDRDQLRAARIPIASSDVVSAALEAPRISRIPKDATHAPLLSALRSPLVGDAALVPIRVDGKPVAIVFAYELLEGAAMAKLDQLASAAGDGLSELLRARRK
jgi:hypothetical protein